MVERLNPIHLAGGKLFDTNPRILEGYSTQECKEVVSYLFKKITNSLMEFGLPISLESITRVPLDMVYDQLRTKTEVDIAESDIVDYAFKFNFKGGSFRMVIGLPIPEGNILKLSSVRYRLLAVVTDMVISTTYNMLTISIDKKVIKATGLAFKYYHNDGMFSNVIVYSPDLFRPNKGRIKIPLLLYKVADFGFEHVLGCPFKLVNVKEYKRTDDESMIYNIEGGRAAKDIYKGSDVGLVFKKSDVTKDRITMIVQVLYCFTVIPQLGEDFLDFYNNPYTLEEENTYWVNCISRLVTNGEKPASFSNIEVEKHLKFTDVNNEEQSYEILAKVGVKVKSYKDILLQCVINYREWTAVGLPSIEKRLETNAFLLSPITRNFNTLFQDLSKFDVNSFSRGELERKFKQNVRQLTIFGLLKNGGSPCIVQCDQNNACPVIQNVKTSTKDKKNVAPENLVPKPGDIYEGNANMIPKQTPAMTTSLNPEMKVDASGVIITNKNVKQLTKQLTK